MLFIEYATRKGLSTWPKGARWPAEIEGETQSDRDVTKRVKEDSAKQSANRRLARDQESQVREQTARRKEQEGRDIPLPDENSQAEVLATHPAGVEDNHTSIPG